VAKGRGGRVLIVPKKEKGRICWVIKEAIEPLDNRASEITHIERRKKKK
jgi:hypothetical protein